MICLCKKRACLDMPRLKLESEALFRQHDVKADTRVTYYLSCTILDGLVQMFDVTDPFSLQSKDLIVDYFLHFQTGFQQRNNS